MVVVCIEGKIDKSEHISMIFEHKFRDFWRDHNDLKANIHKLKCAIVEFSNIFFALVQCTCELNSKCLIPSIFYQLAKFIKWQEETTKSYTAWSDKYQ